MDKKAVVHIYSGVLLIHKKEHIWVSSNAVDEPRAYYTQWSKSEREEQIYINAYIWNLERWYWCTNLQGSNKDVYIENRVGDTEGEEEGGTNGERNTVKYTLPYVKQIANGNLLYDSRSSNWCSVTA